MYFFNIWNFNFHLDFNLDENSQPYRHTNKKKTLMYKLLIYEIEIKAPFQLFYLLDKNELVTGVFVLYNIF